MKKYLFVLFCFALIHGRIIASEKEQISLNVEVGIIDEEPGITGPSKTIVRIPCIYQDGYKLSFSSFHPEYIINIVQDDEVVYSSVIPAGVTEFDLPSYLGGDCIIQFVKGRFCFWGEISL